MCKGIRRILPLTAKLIVIGHCYCYLVAKRGGEDRRLDEARVGGRWAVVRMRERERERESAERTSNVPLSIVVVDSS